MNGSRSVAAAVKVCFALSLTLVVLGQISGQPTGVSYVETESMSPTLRPGDGFVVVPAALAGAPGVGDVVVYNAKALQGGGLTTHRVVGVTEQGYVTRGDGNAYTDQDGGEPFVTEGQIRAVAVRVDGTVVAIPGLGTAAMALKGQVVALQRGVAAATGSRAFLGASGVGYLLLAAGVLLAGATALVSDGGRSRVRNRDRGKGLDPRYVRAALVLLLVAPATAAMVLPGGVHEFDVVSAENPTSSPYVIERGGSSSAEYRVPNGGRLPLVVFLEPASPGVAIDSERLWLEGGDDRTVALTLSVPEETGPYKRAITEHRYLPLLPPSLIAVLYAVHPLLPVAAVDFAVAASVAGAARAVLGSGPIRTRPKRRRSGRRVADALKRWFQ